MQQLTYRQAYDKIIEAYFKDEIEPFIPSFCFCGTLNCNKAEYWQGWSDKTSGIFYEGDELQKMEDALIDTLSKGMEIDCREDLDTDELKDNPKYEVALFDAMSAALDVLKQIHKERGEKVDEDIPVFTQRKLTLS
jgi:hypothetical protein